MLNLELEVKEQLEEYHRFANFYYDKYKKSDLTMLNFKEYIEIQKLICNIQLYSNLFLRTYLRKKILNYHEEKTAVPPLLNNVGIEKYRALFDLRKPPVLNKDILKAFNRVNEIMKEVI